MYAAGTGAWAGACHAEGREIGERGTIYPYYYLIAAAAAAIAALLVPITVV